MSNNKLTPEQMKRVFNTGAMNGKSWANIMDENNATAAAAYARMTPAQKAAHKAEKKRISNLYNIPSSGATRRNNGARAWGTRRNNGARRNNGTRRNHNARAAWRPRPGKVMRECRDNRTGCARHQTTGDCKFVHSDEPEFAHLRANQRL